MMNITVSVMAHPKRRAQAEALALQLKQYPFMDVSITWDELNSEWHTGRMSLMRGARRGDWHLVLQDDAVLTPYLYANIEAVIAAAPTRSVISLYTGKVRPLAERVQMAVDKAPDGSFLSHYMMMWGVAILIPSNHIEPMLEFIDEPKYSDTPYDQRVGIFYQRNRLPIYYTMPSLVDHNDDLGSLIGNGYAKERRVAHRRSKGLIYWTDTVIDI